MEHGNQKNTVSRSNGQALVVLLFYMIIAITIATTAVAVVVSNSLSVTRSEDGIVAMDIAETGGENAIIRLLRDTNYTGETLAIGDGSAVATVSGTTTKTITSMGTVNGSSRTVQIVATLTNGVLTVTSWQEL
ncbi:MAG TPA: hypothetical protein VMR81_02905 [Patescibacteria group bacterium]|nr:hypothetical protein [Patescibacteria group bacterium]